MFTKGKWEISKKQKGSQGWLSWRIFCDEAGGFRPIAKVYLCDIEQTNTHFKDVAEGEANARLIASAPELVAALEQIAAMTYITEIKGKKVEVNTGLVFNIAARAIAKAKGEV